MIRESLYFSFAGRKSIEFPIANVSLNSGLFEEQLTSSKSIIEVSTPKNNTPYFQGVKREPKVFSLRFAFLEPWNDEMIDEIIRWLDKDYYEPLFFSENIDRVFYAMTIETIDQIHNGLKEGYVNLTFRCNSSYSYSHEIISPLYAIENEATVVLENHGHVNCLPEISIKKIGNGTVSIMNSSNRGEITEITNLTDKEEVTIDCLHRQINSNIPNTYRYDDFNDNYLELMYGINHLIVTGSCRLIFKYRYIYR